MRTPVANAGLGSFRPIVLKKSLRGRFRLIDYDIATIITSDINSLIVAISAQIGSRVRILDFFNTIDPFPPLGSRVRLVPHETI
jgi:hypothetical protein